VYDSGRKKIAEREKIEKLALSNIFPSSLGTCFCPSKRASTQKDKRQNSQAPFFHSDSPAYAPASDPGTYSLGSSIVEKCRIAYSLAMTAGVVSSDPSRFLQKKERPTSLDHLCDLGHQRLVNQAVDVEAAHAVDQAKVEVAKVERRQVEAVEQAQLPQLQNHLQLLELEQRLQVELALLEQVLERQNVEVVDRAELRQKLQIQAVDNVKVLEVLVLEVEVVELRQVERGAGRDVRGRGGSGNSGKGADEDAGGLHFE
jgi:hypothetical protein